MVTRTLRLRAACGSVAASAARWRKVGPAPKASRLRPPPLRNTLRVNMVNSSASAALELRRTQDQTGDLGERRRRRECRGARPVFAARRKPAERAAAGARVAALARVGAGAHRATVVG